MRKLKFKLDRKSLEIIYTAFIRPLLEYGDVIWDNCTEYEKKDLDKIQSEAARIAKGATSAPALKVYPAPSHNPTTPSRWTSASLSL